MKKLMLIAALLGSGLCNSQTLKGIELGSQTANKGEATPLIVHLEPVQGKSNWCGLVIFYGDGTTTDHRLEDSDIPLRVTHTYAIAGTYTVIAEGKTIFRGFNTAASCSGSSKTATITVIDPAEKLREQARQAQLEAEQKKKLEELAAANRDHEVESQKRRALEAQELDLKAREISLKRRELQAKERAITAREEELRSKESASKKISTPTSGRPAPTKPPTEAKDTKPSLLDMAQ